MICSLEDVLNEKEVASLGCFGSRLRETGLMQLLALYNYSQINEREQALQSDVGLLPVELADAVRFLVLGEYLTPDRAARLFGEDVVEVCLATSLFQASNGGLTLGGYKLVNHFGTAVFCERIHSNVRFYYGDDSAALGRILSPARGTVLDLCAGVGTQGLLCAASADKVVSIEKQEDAARLYWLNAAVNGVERAMELHIGDFLDAVPRSEYNQICCNPPLLPIAPDMPFPIVGDGGPDGLAFTKKLLEALPCLLAKDGICLMVGTMLGDARGPHTQALEQLAAERGLLLTLMLPFRTLLQRGGFIFESMVGDSAAFAQAGGAKLYREEIRQIYLQHISGCRASHLYSFWLIGRLAQSGPGRLEHTKHFTGHRRLWDL